MIRIGLFILAVLSNLFWVVSSVGAGFITFAQIAPKEITCVACELPEVQTALIQAVTLGRHQVLNQLPSLWLVFALALFNILFIGWLLLKHRPNPSFKRDYLR